MLEGLSIVLVVLLWPHREWFPVLLLLLVLESACPTPCKKGPSGVRHFQTSRLEVIKCLLGKAGFSDEVAAQGVLYL